MDRLPTLIIAAAGLLVFSPGCDRADPQPPPERVNAVRAPPAPEKVGIAELCDVAGETREFSWPSLAGADPGPARGWRWINLWAPWCAPCVEEIPLLRTFERDLARAGTPIELVFLSVDESDEEVEAFRARHPELPPGPRLSRPELLGSFSAAVGLGEDAPIPLHVFVDPAGLVRCARAGTIGHDDYAAIAALLGR
jgi:thiol-disulfide isomerase/thioredoxin